MSIRDRLFQLKTVAVAVVDFVKRHRRLTLALGVGLLIVAPLLTGSGGGSFFLNRIGLGIAALVVRRVMRAGNRRQAAQARQANCRCRCHRQQVNSQQQGGTP